MEGGFATSLCCIDGRIQDSISGWIRERCGVRYVDMITEPGLDKRIADPKTAEELRKKALISIRAHGSKVIVISGHAQCAGNPVSKEEHEKCIISGMQTIRSWKLGAEVLGLWVGPDWKAVPVSE